MNPFEKIFNYRIMSRLDDAGTFLVTSHERAWLKAMLRHPAAAEAFSAETRDKLLGLLRHDDELELSDRLTEKAKSREKQVYHPLLRPLRRLIREKSGMRLTYGIKSGRTIAGQFGLPYKLEYSMVKREWYLLWFQIRRQSFMSTRLSGIVAVSAEPIEPSAAERMLTKIGQTLDSRKTESVVEVVRDYNKELSRILYAFSCFEKDVAYDAESDRYRVHIRLQADEREYLLSKIRFLGKRVRVVEDDYLRKRMLESSRKALERYGVTGAEKP
ncbi:WYL domain-containing protein [Paenibacillus sp. GYB003]|uniref:WYL domain-containing protein n=1 Tax=Paenibacillus sp. GYB003 TaxID=2994392 RepID=UPI002F96A810